MVLPISPVANISLGQRQQPSLINLPGFGQPQQAQRPAPTAQSFNFGPLQSPQQQGQGGLPLVAAGLSLLSGQGDPGQAIMNLISGQRQAQQDALKFELLRREEARVQSKHQVELNALGLSQQKFAELGLFVDTLKERGQGNQAMSDFANALDASLDLAIATGKTSALETGLSGLQTLRNDNDVVGTTQQMLEELGKGRSDVSVNARQKRDLDRQDAALAVQQRNAATSAGSLAVQRDQLALAQEKQQFELGQLEGGFRTPRQRVEDQGKLRKEYTQLSKPFLDISEQFGRLSSLDPSAAGDLSLIYAYQRMLSPGIVTDREVDMMAAAGELSARVEAAYNRVVTGEKLAPSVRDDFIQQATNIYQAQLDQQNKNKEIFTGLAEKAKLDPSQVVIPIGEQDIGSTPPVDEPAPAGGTGTFGAMQTQEFENIDLDNLTPAEVTEWLAEMARREAAANANSP